MRFRSSASTPKPVTAGGHIGEINCVAAIGTQETKNGMKSQVAIGVALLDEFDDEGRPRLMTQRMTNSLYKEARLGKMLAGLVGHPLTVEEKAAFDPRKLLGRLASVTVSMWEERSVIDTIQPLPAALRKQVEEMDRPAVEHRWLSLERDEYNAESYRALPEWMQTLIAKSPEWQQLQEEQAHEGNDAEKDKYADIRFDDDESDCPF